VSTNSTSIGGRHYGLGGFLLQSAAGILVLAPVHLDRGLRTRHGSSRILRGEPVYGGRRDENSSFIQARNELICSTHLGGRRSPWRHGEKLF
jgi:hypothetical protein